MAAIIESGSQTVGEKFGKDEVSSVSWMERATGLSIKEITLDSLSDTGGASGSGLTKVRVLLNDGTEQAYILKSRASDATGSSLGLAREAYFYQYFGPRVSSMIPQIVSAFGNFETGDKALLMENLSDCIQTGYFFGKHSPHNQHKNLTEIVGYEDSSPQRIRAMELISERAFQFAGRVHVEYWNEKSLLQTKWVRASEWLRGEGEASWKAAQGHGIAGWNNVKAKLSAATEEEKAKMVKWDPLMWDIIESSISKISWEDYQNRIKEPGYNFTLVHGDFHPANMMWRRTQGGSTDVEEDGQLILLDWEVVGVGYGAQDCCQYVISHMRPDERRACESRLLHAYYDALIRGGVNSIDYSYEQCYRDYVDNGMARWVWLITLCSLFMDASWIQFFHDQMLAFAQDHNVTPASIPMPRV